MGCGSRSGVTYECIAGCRCRSACIWLPERIVARDRNVFALTVGGDSFIYKVWFNNAAILNAPIDPYRIAGRYVRDFVPADEAERIQAWIQNVLSRKTPMQTIITLAIPVKHNQRIVRLLPINANTVLAYLIKEG